MTRPTCHRCGTLTREGATLCVKHTHTLDVALGNIAAYWTDLDTLRTKTTRYGQANRGGKGAKGKTMPLGIDLRFAPVTRDDQGRVLTGQATLVMTTVRDTLITWVRTCIDTWGGTLPAGRATAVCAHLQSNLFAISGQDWADTMLTDLLDAERQLRQLVDRPPAMIYAGTCFVCACVNQHVPLYAREGDTEVTCPSDDCGMTYDVATRREAMVADIESRLCTAAEIASLATYLELLEDRDRVRKRINLWAHRGVIQPDQINHDGEPLYAFGPVVDRLRQGDLEHRTRLAQNRVLARKATG